jgi:hypothetical protein
MELLIAAMVALQFWGSTQPVVGTYQIAADPSGMLIRLDTRTGLAERCVLNGTALTCVPFAAR